MLQIEIVMLITEDMMSTKNKTKTTHFILTTNYHPKDKDSHSLATSLDLNSYLKAATAFLLPTPQTNPLNHTFPVVGHPQISNWKHNKATDGL